MATHVIIPARYGSSRFEGKPLFEIAGKPMIQRVMEQAARATGVAGVYVATDDQRIVDAVEAFGGRALMTGETARSGSDRVAEAAAMLDIGDDELVANVQGDQPLLPPELINICAAPLAEDAALNMTTPVTPFKSAMELADPTNVKTVMDANHDALYFSRATVPFARDGGEVTCHKHLGVYVFRKSFLDTFARLDTGRLEAIEKLEQLRVLEAGYSLRCVITDMDSPEVDRPEHAEAVARALTAGPKD